MPLEARRATAVPIDARWGWVVNATLRPLYLQKRVPVPIVQEAGWTSEPVWICTENLSSHWSSNPETSRYIDFSIQASRTITGNVLKLMCLGLLAKGLDVSLLLTLALRITTPISSETSTHNPVPCGARTPQTRPLIKNEF
jgi:hypothetical protein